MGKRSNKDEKVELICNRHEEVEATSSKDEKVEVICNKDKDGKVEMVCNRKVAGDMSCYKVEGNGGNEFLEERV